jgi:hypothetical protein
VFGTPAKACAADAAFDTTTPTGKLMLTVLGGIADYADTAIMRSWAVGMQA